MLAGVVQNLGLAVGSKKALELKKVWRAKANADEQRPCEALRHPQDLCVLELTGYLCLGGVNLWSRTPTKYIWNRSLLGWLGCVPLTHHFQSPALRVRNDHIRDQGLLQLDLELGSQGSADDGVAEGRSQDNGGAERSVVQVFCHLS